jgi:carboxyl-terminal processing protease
MADASTGYLHVNEFTRDSASRIKQAVDTLTRSGASRFVIDLRGTATGDLDDGLAAARLFVKTGTLGVKQGKTAKEPVAANSGDGGIAARTVLLVNQGTAGAAEVFAAALDGNDRAQLIGERTLGRAARQRLVKLPDGSGLLLTMQRYLTPASKPIHEKGLEPDVEVDQPEVEFGSEPPATDTTLDKALQVLNDKQEAGAAKTAA